MLFEFPAQMFAIVRKEPMDLENKCFHENGPIRIGLIMLSDYAAETLNVSGLVDIRVRNGRTRKAIGCEGNQEKKILDHRSVFNYMKFLPNHVSVCRYENLNESLHFLIK